MSTLRKSREGSLVAPLTPEDLLGMRRHEMVLRMAAGEHRPLPLTTFVVRSEVPLLHVVPGKVRIAVYA